MDARPGWIGITSTVEVHALEGLCNSPVPTRLGTRWEAAHHGSAFIIDTGNTKKKISLLGLFRGLSALPLHVAVFVAVFVAIQLEQQTRFCRVF